MTRRRARSMRAALLCTALAFVTAMCGVWTTGTYWPVRFAATTVVLGVLAFVFAVMATAP